MILAGSTGRVAAAGDPADLVLLGHHAGADFFGGYCFLNNAAVAADMFRAAGAGVHDSGERCQTGQVGTALTMTVGNVLAIWQTSVKRILAYSSISNVGFALIGIAAIFGAPQIVAWIRTLFGV